MGFNNDVMETEMSPGNFFFFWTDTIVKKEKKEGHFGGSMKHE
jgi:hypothetical protein